ncbi:OmpW family outer membrane protein [Pseudomonas sp. F1_0610]|uniref:OmpW/AlkL family protein n=1 Tax=Pseudomonas sp. F1_0610 TaxID=3114284 RepID=UPI0039C2F6F2
MRKSLFTASLLALAVATPAAFAHQAGDIIVRAGAVTVTTNEDSSKIKVNGAKIDGTKAKLNDNTQLGLNFAYMVTDNIGIELLAATPFKHTAKVAGLDAATGIDGLDGKLGTFKHLPPTLSAVWYPMDGSWKFQPYVGLGVNYTWFFDEKVSSSAKNGPGEYRKLKVKDSWGWAAQIGADYMLTDNLLINGQIRYIDINTDASVQTALGKAKVGIDVKPWVYMVGLGYKF